MIFEDLEKKTYSKFGEVDGPNLCRLKKVDVSSKFIENIFWSGLTLVNSNNHQNR